MAMPKGPQAFPRYEYPRRLSVVKGEMERRAPFRSTLKKHGFEKDARCGYAVGNEWNEPRASLKHCDLTVLKPNMTFHLMLGNWIDEDLGYVNSKTFRVTETGTKTFSCLPRDLFGIGL